jgi:hypothetical protein
MRFFQKNSKLQHPSTRESSSPKPQSNFRRELNLEFGASLELGAWNLELSQSRLLSRGLPQ